MNFFSHLEGLSPRVRGNPGGLSPAQLRVRSIPACTGEPGVCPCAEEGAAVYPRVYGGTGLIHTRPSLYRGLSPRVRGNHMSASQRTENSRSIPACTGEPGDAIHGGCYQRVYPRVYGGTELPRTENGLDHGLSPRVRGNHKEPDGSDWYTRSIPACTGEPWSDTRRGRISRVYPRVYGGTQADQRGEYHRYGLSPRVRGNRHDDKESVPDRGSIPACTGEPRLRRRNGQPHPVYPRVYGGTRERYLQEILSYGLSPRVRGNRT